MNSVFSLNGAIAPPRTLPPRSSRPMLPTVPHRWGGPLAYAAIAVLVIMALVTGYFTLVRQPEPASPLPGVATPTTEGTPAADWPMYRGNPAHTGVMPGPGLDGQPVELWRFRAGGPASRSPAVAAGVAYLQSADGNVYAVDATTGAELWRTDLGVAEDTPAIAGDTLFVNDGNGAILALDAKTGAERWRPDILVPPVSPPVVDGDTLYIGGQDGQVAALNATTGSEIWRVTVDTAVNRSVTVANGLVYVPLVNNSLHVLDSASGAERWTFTGDEPDLAIGTTTVMNGVVYVVIQDTLIALDAADGEEHWRTTIEGVRPVAVVGNLLVTPGLDGVVYGLDAATGEQRWTFETEGRIQAAPSVIGDTAYIPSYDKTLYGLDVNTGEQRWAFELDGAVDYGPSVANGVIYISTDLGSLYALGSSGLQQMAAPIVAQDMATPTASTQAAGAAIPLVAPPTFLWQSAGGPDPLYAVGAVAIAPDGNVWVMDCGNDRFQIFAPDGTFLDTWDGTGGGGKKFGFAHHDNGFDGDFAFDPDGNIYVSEAGAKRVQVFDSNRHLLTTWGESGRENGQFIKPIGLALDSTGNVYVLDYDRRDIQKFTNSGQWLATFGNSGDGRMREGTYLTIDGEDTLWVTDNKRLLALSTDGAYLGEIGSGGDGPGQFDEVIDVAVDANDIIFVADLQHGWIQAFREDGTLLAVWDAGRTPAGGQNLPYAVAPDNQGNLYVTGVAPDYNSDSNIQKFALPTLTP